VKPEPHVMGERILLSNSGLIPIEEIETTLEITLQRTGLDDRSLNLRWIRQEVLNSKEETTITLYEKLDEFFLQNGFIKKYEIETPSGETDPETGDYIMITSPIYHLERTFSAMVNLEVKSKIEGHSVTVKKKFVFHYEYMPEVFEIPPPSSLEFEDDYRIDVTEHMGEWQD
jgi:hypothetical protein